MNNILLIKPFLKFESDDEFYILEIIKRRKENPNLKKNNICLMTYFITSISDLDTMMPDFIKICDITNSRLYINLNVRSFHKVILQANKKIGELLVTGDYKFGSKVYMSSCHRYGNGNEKTWIVDIDWDNEINTNTEKGIDNIAKLEEFIVKLQKDSGRNPIKTYIPTKNGCHLITAPFNKKKFKAEYPTIEIHGDNPTLCYFP